MPVPANLNHYEAAGNYGFDPLGFSNWVNVDFLREVRGGGASVSQGANVAAAALARPRCTKPCAPTHTHYPSSGSSPPFPRAGRPASRAHPVPRPVPPPCAQAELKHGRICQLAVVGFAATDLGFRVYPDPNGLHQVPCVIGRCAPRWGAQARFSDAPANLLCRRDWGGSGSCGTAPAADPCLRPRSQPPAADARPPLAPAAARPRPGRTGVVHRGARHGPFVRRHEPDLPLAGHLRDHLHRGGEPDGQRGKRPSAGRLRPRPHEVVQGREDHGGHEAQGDCPLPPRHVRLQVGAQPQPRLLQSRQTRLGAFEATQPNFYLSTECCPLATLCI